MSLPQRLLASSARHQYDPDVDIDWSVGPVPGLWFMPPERMSLYGTDLWNQLTEAQRMELSKYEVASIASVGMWFEITLMKLLLRDVYNRDPLSEWVRYALTEVADECRHTIMFSKGISQMGAPAYGPSAEARRMGRLSTLAVRGPAFFAATLLGEEPVDRMQREWITDERLQPAVRMIARIHVLEEARHVSFARAELAESAPNLGRTQRKWHQFLIAQAAYMTMRSLVNPQAYATVGIDPREGRHAALSNPNYRRTIAWMGERVMPFLDELDLVGKTGRTARLWHASFLAP